MRNLRVLIDDFNCSEATYTSLTPLYILKTRKRFNFAPHDLMAFTLLLGIVQGAEQIAVALCKDVAEH